jgi:hypothetical protein
MERAEEDLADLGTARVEFVRVQRRWLAEWFVTSAAALVSLVVGVAVGRRWERSRRAASSELLQ